MQYDLTPVLFEHLDDHFKIQVLDFLELAQCYDPKDVLAAKLEVLGRTKMHDFAKEQRVRAIEQGVPGVQPLRNEETLRKDVLEQVEKLKRGLGPLLGLLDDPKLLDSLLEGGSARTPLPLSALSQTLGEEVTETHVKALYDYARLYYEVGQYTSSAAWLQLFGRLSGDSELRHLALWGQLAGNLSTLNILAAIDDVQHLKQLIEDRCDSGRASQLQTLKHRTWLAHWALFLYEDEKGRDAMIRLYLPDERRVDDKFAGGNQRVTLDHKMVNAVQVQCPHILRYLCAAILLHENRRRYMRDLLRILSQTPDYQDPMTEFVRSLFQYFDFDTAQQSLKGVFQLTANDFFLHWVADDLRNVCRRLLFENFCRINHSGDIDELAKHLGIDVEQQRVEHEQRQRFRPAAGDDDAGPVVDGGDAGTGGSGQQESKQQDPDSAAADFQPKEVQPQLVELIRATGVWAKIDSSTNRLIVGKRSQPVAQNLIFKTRQLVDRTYNLTSHLERKHNDLQQQYLD